MLFEIEHNKKNYIYLDNGGTGLSFVDCEDDRLENYRRWYRLRKDFNWPTSIGTFK